jgi:hypothetical protein
MKEQPSAYHSYLIRLWPAGDEGQAGWRASLENSRTGKRIGFASIEELFDYLRLETGVSPADE